MLPQSPTKLSEKEREIREHGQLFMHMLKFYHKIRYSKHTHTHTHTTEGTGQKKVQQKKHKIYEIHNNVYTNTEKQHFKE